MTYLDLVNKRKAYIVNFRGFINQSQIENNYDEGDYLEPWAQWHNSIPADILVIGQDWGGQDYYVKNRGKDILSNTTCYNLIALFKEINIDIGSPDSPTENLKLHFTNIIPFIRTGPMQGNKENKDNDKSPNIINSGVIYECAIQFLSPLIEIVNPKVIITLGSFAFKGLQKVHPLKNKKLSFTKMVEHPSLETKTGIKVFPMFHCGTLGVNINRKLDLQKKDWNKINLA